MENRILLKPDEAAQQLGLSRSRIYQLLAEGELPSIRIGKSVRVPLQALTKWVDRQMEPLTEENVRKGRQ